MFNTEVQAGGEQRTGCLTLDFLILLYARTSVKMQKIVRTYLKKRKNIF